MTNFRFRTCEVGGAVRDELMGRECKDVDFTVEAPSFAAMIEGLEADGFKIHTITERFLTARARVPKGHPLESRTKDADFVLARKDSATSDGRRPDFVEPGTILDDLARRDFTINAIAKDCETGEIIDPFNGRADIENRTLRFVGAPRTRIAEDGLRVMRGFRFMVTLDMFPESVTFAALTEAFGAEMLRQVSIERVQIELSKMFRADIISTIGLLDALPHVTKAAIFRDGLRLDATLKA